jgi:hypothetical protein
MSYDVGRSKRGDFRHRKDCILKKIHRWLEQLLAAGGRRSWSISGSGDPHFSMSCFKLPIGLWKAINVMILSFRWGSENIKRKKA